MEMGKLARMGNAKPQIFVLVKLAGKDPFVKYAYPCLVVSMETAQQLLNVHAKMDGQVDFVKYVSYNKLFSKNQHNRFWVFFLFNLSCLRTSQL